MDETGFRQGNGDGKNPQKSKGWLWVVVPPLVSYFSVFLSRSQEVAKAILGDAFNGIVGSDRCSSYSWLCNGQRQVCWAHLKRDFTKIAERSGRSTKLGKALLKQQNPHSAIKLAHRIINNEANGSQPLKKHEFSIKPNY